VEATGQLGEDGEELLAELASVPCALLMEYVAGDPLAQAAGAFQVRGWLQAADCRVLPAAAPGCCGFRACAGQGAGAGSCSARVWDGGRVQGCWAGLHLRLLL
jgi:hypothetical protein